MMNIYVRKIQKRRNNFPQFGKYWDEFVDDLDLDNLDFEKIIVLYSYWGMWISAGTLSGCVFSHLLHPE